MAFVSFLETTGSVNQTSGKFSTLTNNLQPFSPSQSVIAAGSMIGGPGSVRIPVKYIGAPNSLTLLQKSKPKAYCF
jgi:hypothetical protein